MHDFSISTKDVEALCIKIFNAKSKNIFVNTTYSQPSGTYENFETYFKTFFKKVNITEVT